jgi:hypothetical protein
MIGDTDSGDTPTVTVVLNWCEELRRLVPVS